MKKTTKIHQRAEPGTIKRRRGRMSFRPISLTELAQVAGGGDDPLVPASLEGDGILY